jgi:hypothetical protein
MAKRTTQSVVSFTSSFILPGFDAPEPPGKYRVDYDEESLDIPSRQAWLRVASFMHLPAIGVRSATHQLAPVSSVDLEAALEKDRIR